MFTSSKVAKLSKASKFSDLSKVVHFSCILSLQNFPQDLVERWCQSRLRCRDWCGTSVDAGTNAGAGVVAGDCVQSMLVSGVMLVQVWKLV